MLFLNEFFVTPYIDNLLAQRKQRSAAELAWELRAALQQKLARGGTLNAVETLALQVCTVAHCDGIQSILKSKRKSVQAAADFAHVRGLAETAKILANALNGEPVSGPVSMSANIRGEDVPIPLSPELNDKWAATDLTLSLIDESMDEALLDYIAEQRTEFARIEAPAEVVAKNALNSRIAGLASKKTALEFVRELLAHRSARIRACISNDGNTLDASDCLEIPVAHRAGQALSAKQVELLRQQHGAAAHALLDIYAAFNGAEFFVAQNEVGFVLLPVEHWKESIDHIMLWARDVDYQDDSGEIPDYHAHAIPFGHIPGDARYWLLITRGKHAGKVMLSGDDVFEDLPRYDSIGEFFAAFILNIPGVLGSGGYVSYHHAERDVLFYPREYLF